MKIFRRRLAWCIALFLIVPTGLAASPSQDSGSTCGMYCIYAVSPRVLHGSELSLTGGMGNCMSTAGELCKFNYTGGTCASVWLACYGANFNWSCNTEKDSSGNPVNGCNQAACNTEYNSNCDYTGP